MRAATDRLPLWRDDAGRRRAVSLALAIAVHLLLLLLLLRLAPPFEQRKPPDQLKVVPLQPETPDQLRTHSARARKAAGGAKAPARAAAAPAPLPAPQPVPTKQGQARPWVLNPDLAGFDLSKVPQSPQAPVTAANEGRQPSPERGEQSEDVIGTGPGGQELWRFQGFRRPPTSAEVYPYLPKDRDANGREVFRRVGWGSIACRIVAGDQLEDCEELAETPGSGFSRALRQMAWQFRVLPPKRNGAVVYGTWINICMTFDQDGVTPRDTAKDCAGPWRGVLGRKGHD